MVTAGAELAPGAIVDRRYRIQCTLGRGGFGRTYLAADEQRFNELCVLKEFVPNAQADPVVSQKLRELFQREAETLHQLDHIQIPQFFAGFEAEERLFIAQEYIDGKTYWRLLQERQRQGCSFSQSEVLLWLKNLLNVLDYLHGKNIVHRDISPDNIMLKRGSQLPVLIDFGVVKQIIPHLHLVNPHDPDGLIQASVSVGKFGYAPYEQIRMGQCSPRSDLYALAVTAVVLLTGKPPNLLMDAKSLEWKWQNQVRLDPQFAQVLSQMMADKPQERYASAQAILQALAPLESLTSLIQASSRQSATRPARSLRQKTGARWFEAPAASELNSLEVTAAEGVMAGATAELAELPLAAAQAGVIESPIDSQSSSQSSALSSLEIVAATPEARTQLEAALLPITSQIRSQIKSQASLQSLIQKSIRQLPQSLTQPPQDQLGNSPSSRFSLRRVLTLSVLALLPLGGATLGIRSPHIASLCGVLSNCAADAVSESQYQQAIQQADSAGLLLSQARDLTGLQQARQKLADSVAQLNAFSSGFKGYASAHLVLPRYQTLLAKLDENLEKQSRATQLLSRAEAEAQRAIEQTNIAKTYSQYEAAQLQWRRSLATLSAVPKDSFASSSAAAKIREYQARLDAVNLKLTAMVSPATAAKSAASPAATDARSITATPVRTAAPSATAARSTVARSSTSVQQTATPARSAAPRQTAAVRQQATPTRPAQRPASRPQSRSSRAPVPSITPRQTPRTPATSPLQVDRQWVAGSVLTSATQTLDNVAIWIDGTRTEADGKFVANLWIQNRSGRGFGFGPLYAESKDENGQIYRSRVLFTSEVGTMLEPGKGLSGQIYLLDRPGLDKSRLTLVVQESTSGERSFRIPF
ncbi:MAG: protein kinase [Pegethrix bostrychoides GSE-TBD4-15B]|jgi:serine/threonine-protein kinase|uniref:non-specific serine/threonine protein kinase n=1 Tax=Pegethrix bostrychoides GSE-TBD4-15B TaxID=2839662 RepID=A0A951U386_9CYAN|nr:protein kinase [Pegethrix bostrychoides GSE-TBD4-15B]